MARLNDFTHLSFGFTRLTSRYIDDNFELFEPLLHICSQLFSLCLSALTWIDIVCSEPWPATTYRLPDDHALHPEHLLLWGTSPFHRPPGWTPPATTPHRPVILQLDLKPMQQMADRNPYFNILAPKVAGNLSTAAYDSLFQTFKVIYPDYASSHFVSDLKTFGD